MNNEIPLKHFQIKSLFGDMDVNISFDSNVNIIIGENGRGKTTILSTLYNVLSCNFYNLNTIEFEYIEVVFSSGEKIKITKDDLVLPFDEINSKLVNDIREVLTENEIQNLIETVDNNQRLIEHPSYLKFRRTRPISHMAFTRVIKELSEVNNFKINDFKKTIQNEIPYKVLYFPTYRRIEEDLYNLGYSESFPINNSSGNLINFGMNDVKQQFKKITDEIKDSTIQGFSKVNGQILNQLIYGINVTEEMEDYIQRPDALKIVLERIGVHNIAKENKDEIINIIEKGAINDKKYKPLVYFLYHLIKTYDEQQENEKGIITFKNLCNKYLVNKKVEYKEETVELFIQQIKTNNKIELANLSSGEKQLLSIFTKIYLELREEFILIFDEPELSLSLKWQQNLLPDIIDSKKCKLLISATHSPFIFENELDKYANDLDNYIKELS